MSYATQSTCVETERAMHEAEVASLRERVAQIEIDHTETIDSLNVALYERDRARELLEQARIQHAHAVREREELKTKWKSLETAVGFAMAHLLFECGCKSDAQALDAALDCLTNWSRYGR